MYTIMSIAVISLLCLSTLDFLREHVFYDSGAVGATYLDRDREELNKLIKRMHIQRPRR